MRRRAIGASLAAALGLSLAVGVGLRWPGGSSYATFEFAPESGTGLTAECACTAVTGARGEVVTTTRSGGAYCTKRDYSLTLCANSNEPRVMTGGGSTLPLGLMFEFTAATNLQLYARDLSNAAWTKSASMTCAKTATGADGVANSASTCTSSGTNVTVTQAVVTTGQHAASIYIKRRTGTGTVSVTSDGSTYTDITSRLSSSIYKRIVNTETPGCMYGGCIVVRAMAQSFAGSPTLGIKIATSGDAVDLDFAQLETGYVSSSPWPTTSASATRASETHSAAVSAFTPKSMSYYVLYAGQASATKYNIQVSAYKDATNEFIGSMDDGTGPLAGAHFCMAYTAGVLQEHYSTFPAPTMGPVWVGCQNDGTTISANVAGYANSDTATVSPATAVTQVWLGGRTGAAGTGVVLSRVCLDSNIQRCYPTRNVASNAVVWLGDSIVAGTVSAPTMPPAELSGYIGRTVYNKGTPGDAAAACHTSWTNSIRNKNYSTLVYVCGTNNSSGLTPATGSAAFAVSQTTLEEALSDGMRVVAVNILPMKNAAVWSSSVQTHLAAYNSSMQAWCNIKIDAGYNLGCVNAYAAFGGEGGDPAVLLAAFDSGDLRHPNAAGASYLAALVWDAGSP
jgi:hypothetical protein